MMDRWYVLRNKKPVPVADLHEWAKEMEISRRVVRQDTIDGVAISTVFLGLDHNYAMQGPPQVFETMIFGGDHDQYCERYSTWDEAEAGHARAVKLVRG